MRERLSAIVAVGAGWLAVMPSSILSLALRIEEIDSPAFVYSATLLLGWTALIVAVNIFGRLSDRWLRLRRRSQALLIACTGAMFGLNWALSETYSDVLLPAIWILLQIPVAALVSFAMTAAATSGDIQGSNRTSALVGAMPLFATLIGSVIVQVIDDSTLNFLLPAALSMIGLLPFIITFPNRADQAPQVISPASRRSRGWRWFLLASFFASWTTSATTSYLVPYASTVLETPAESLAGATSGILVGATALSILGSLLLALRPHSARIERLSFSIGTALMTSGVALLVLLPSLVTLAIGGWLCGLGFGLVNGVELRITQSFAKHHGDTGRRIGELTAVTTLPYVAVPAIGTIMLSLEERLGLIGNFATAALCSAVASIIYVRKVNLQVA